MLVSRSNQVPARSNFFDFVRSDVSDSVLAHCDPVTVVLSLDVEALLSRLISIDAESEVLRGRLVTCWLPSGVILILGLVEVEWSFLGSGPNSDIWEAFEATLDHF